MLTCLKEYLWLDTNAKNEYYKAGVAKKQVLPVFSSLDIQLSPSHLEKLFLRELETNSKWKIVIPNGKACLTDVSTLSM